MDRDLIEQISVPKSRLVSGVWKGDRETGEGDIHASYSADLIAMTGKVRAPFRHGSHLWICVGIRGREPELEAYRLTPESMFTDPVTSYSAKVSRDSGDAARNDPQGFYHGMAVEHGGMRYVLSGPPSLFIADPEAETTVPAQLDLFGCAAKP
jgi:hypothetical protein